jgi:hypothetical protein
LVLDELVVSSADFFIIDSSNYTKQPSQQDEQIFGVGGVGLPDTSDTKNLFQDFLTQFQRDV